jgi:hypothetical protein
VVIATICIKPGHSTHLGSIRGNESAWHHEISDIIDVCATISAVELAILSLELIATLGAFVGAVTRDLARTVKFIEDRTFLYR